MTHNVYKSIEMVGSSPDSTEDAIRKAVERAGQTVRNVQWFEVKEQRGYVENGSVKDFQVKLTVWFALEDGEGQ